jgi:hypothetical protein
MIHAIRWLGVLAVAGLCACGEQAQTATAHKVDDKPWQGAVAAYAAPGWKAGDRASWDEQMKQRSQAQNEYARAPAKP